jgi:endonuclease V-like protein UPF0215 family
VAISHVIGFDDAPFARSHRGNVRIVGTVYAGERLEGVLSGFVRRDGRNATSELIRLVSASRFYEHLQLVMTQGIAFAGFNVIDIHALHEALRVPVLVVARRRPDLSAIHEALVYKVRGGARKWRLIEAAGLMEHVAGVYIQRAGLTRAEAAEVLGRFAINGRMPEPLRTAHLVAGGIETGESRHRV